MVPGFILITFVAYLIFTILHINKLTAANVELRGRLIKTLLESSANNVKNLNQLQNVRVVLERIQKLELRMEITELEWNATPEPYIKRKVFRSILDEVQKNITYETVTNPDGTRTVTGTLFIYTPTTNNQHEGT